MPEFNAAFPLPHEIDFAMIMPILVVMVTGMVALAIEMLRPKQNNNAIVFASLTGLAVSAILTITQFGQPSKLTLVDMLLRDQFGLICQLLLVLGCALTFLFSETYLRTRKIAFGEFYPMALWSTGGAMIMATSNNLLVIFLGLEILSIALYVLAGLARAELKSEESSLKYFLLGAFASGFFLYGIAMFYGATGSLDLTFLANGLTGNATAKVMLIFGTGLMLVGLGFKAALVPFHQWTPDVYQGAPTNVTAFMAVISKIGAIAALFRVLVAAAPLKAEWMPAMMAIAILTMIVGNAVALLQNDIKRILGYSSIAHAGYLLVGLLSYVNAPDKVGIGTTAYYLLSYTFMTIGAFAVVSLIAQGGRETTRIEHLNGLWQRDRLAAVLLVVFMVSLIGIPPSAGFFGKFFIFQDAVAAGLTPLALVLAVASVISISYYLRIARAAFVVESDTERPPLTMSPALRATGVVCMAGVVLVGILVTPVQRFLLGPTESGPVEATRVDTVSRR